MADLRISQLAALAAADLAAADLLPVADISASETKKITVSDFAGKAVTLVADASIPGAKILFGSSQVPGSALVDGGVSTAKLADDAVTAAKLGNESTVDLVTTLPAAGAFVGQLALDTDDLKVYCWDGSVWQSFKAAGSVNTVVGSGTGIVNVTTTVSGDTVTIATTLDNTTGAAQFLAGPTGGAGAVGYRAIVGTDLPAATSSAAGAVVVNGEGLRMDGSQIEIANDVTQSTDAVVVTYNSKGLVTGGRAIVSSDLPVATSGSKGAVLPGTGLSVDGSGVMGHTNTATAGTYPKVTIDAQGHVTTGSTLSDTDIPELPASKITSGTLNANLLGTNSVVGTKLANYATVKFGGASSTQNVVTFPTADYTGQMFFDATNGDLYLYDGNTWQPITITAGELIYAGTYNAGTNKVKSVTAAGTAAGLVVGSALPAASNSNLRYYLVVSDSGTGTAPAPAVALAPPDMIVSGGTTWELVDVSNAIAGQIASNISFTPAGSINATNVQTAIQELDDEKLAKAGGTITGNLEIGNTGSLTWEGSTADAYETTLAVVDPTADRTITLPDASGTVVTTGDTGTVTSTMIANGTIVDADINASAAIADTKLATISTAGKVSNSATTATSANTASAIVARDGSGNFTAGTITASLTGAASLNVLKAGDTLTGALGVTAGTVGAPGVFFSGDTNTGIYSPGADQVAISTNGSGRLFVDSSGNVGVGATPSAWSVGKAVQIGNAANALFGATSSQLNLMQNANFDSDFKYVNTAAASYYQQLSGSHIWYTAASGTAGATATFSERLRITNTGLVGIGVSSPNSLMHLFGGDLRVQKGNGATDVSEITLSNIFRTGRILSSYTDPLNTVETYISFHTNRNGGSNDALVEAMRIAGGNVGIGTNAPQGLLDLAAADSATALAVAGWRAASYNGTVLQWGGIAASQWSAAAFFTGGSERARITSTGALALGNSGVNANIGFRHGKTITGGTTSWAQYIDGTVQTDVTVSAIGVATSISTAASTSLSSLVHYQAATGTLGAGTSITTQIGFSASSTLDGATNDFGFYGNIGAGSGNWNCYMVGAAPNFFNGQVQLGAGSVGTPSLSTNADTNTGLFFPAADNVALVEGGIEAFRVTSDPVIAYHQVDPTSKNAAATLTIAELKTGIIQYTGAAATLTLPTGTLTEGGFSAVYTNLTFEWSVINTGSGACTIGAGSGHTIVGGATIAAGDSGRFASRRTASNTFVTYRLS